MSRPVIITDGRDEMLREISNRIIRLKHDMDNLKVFVGMNPPLPPDGTPPIVKKSINPESDTK